MRSLLLWLLVTLLTWSAIAHPQISSGLHRRNDSSSFNKLSISVLSPNGTDVTSAFQTRVYYRAKVEIPHPDPNSLNESTPTNFADLNPRGTLTYSYLGRPIGGDGICKSRTAKFQHSVCSRSLGVRSTVQDFVVFCQETEEAYAAQNPRYTPRPSTANRGGHASTSYEPHIPPILDEEGECFSDEICMDGIFKDRGYPALASCVTEEDFVEDENEDLDLGGLNAKITVTNLGSRRPVTMRKMEIKAAGPDSSASSSRTNHKTCGSCSDLAAGPLTPDVESLKVEASLMTAGAVAGILWIALASG